NPFYANYKYESVKLAKKFSGDKETLQFGSFNIECIHIPGHTPGSMAYILEIWGKKILFGGDLPGIAINIIDGNLNDYINSMQKLLTLDIDISCEGHEKVIEPQDKIRKYIKGYIEFNKDLNSVVLENPTNKEAILNLALQSYEIEWYSSVVDFCNYLLEIDPNNSDAIQLLEKAKQKNPPKVEFIKRLIEQNYKGE
ncbi:MAG: MBL fold metallo-hydrolase, partial [Candidatus Heimdallarchaeota archaeon]